MENTVNKRYLFLDTETTGLDPFHNSVIQIGAIIYEDDVDGEPIEIARYSASFSAYKDSAIDIEALQVNDTSIGEVRSFDSDPDVRKAIFWNFAEWLRRYVTKNTLIIGHNIDFDSEFLNAEADRYSLDFSSVLSDRKRIDTRQIAIFLDDAKLIQPVNHRMVTIYNSLFDARIADNEHNALSDAIMDAGVYFKMREMV